MHHRQPCKAGFSSPAECLPAHAWPPATATKWAVQLE